MDWKNISNFKRAVLIGGRLGVYSRLISNKAREEENNLTFINQRGNKFVYI